MSSLPTEFDLEEFEEKPTLQNWICRTSCVVVSVSALLIGIFYGSTAANVYFSIRKNVRNKAKRLFVLGNIQLGSALGQLIGSLMPFAFEEITANIIAAKHA